jgi:chromosome segregation ATPase
MDAAETGLYERETQRAEIDRLVADLQESRAALARSGEELEAKVSALARMETAHRELVLRNQVLERSLSRLQQQHDALLRDYVFALERVAVALERLRS